MSRLDNEYVKYLEKYLNGDDLKQGLERLKKGEPPQYIVGNTDFYGYIFNVNNNVLIPRFETELLVWYTIKFIKDKFGDKQVSIVDLGTGSGNIAVVLKKEVNSLVVGIDISLDAINVAKKNASLNNAEINFICNDMLDNIDLKFDVIISNPPYIRNNEPIMDIVKNNEPALALYGGEDGLVFYDKILSSCAKNLNDNYLIAFEIGYEQGESVVLLAKKYLNCDVSLLKDYSGKDRFVFIYNKSV